MSASYIEEYKKNIRLQKINDVVEELELKKIYNKNIYAPRRARLKNKIIDSNILELKKLIYRL